MKPTALPGAKSPAKENLPEADRVISPLSRSTRSATVAKSTKPLISPSQLESRRVAWVRLWDRLLADPERKAA